VNPLVTIVLLCYKHEEFAKDSVSGVLSQTYSPLEIIIFDDCSPDRTAEMIERTIAENPPRHNVRFIRNSENVGGNAVVRRGLKMAKGEFIFVSHGDDVMLPEMVEEIASVWRSENVSLVAANATYIDDNSNDLNRTFRDPNIPADDSFETLVRDGSNACCFGPTIGFERAVYEKFGWVPEYLFAYDIIYPFYAYLLKGAKFVNKPLLKYRVHSQNSSLSRAVEKANALEKSLIEERMLIGHIAHALLMEEEIDRLRNEMPQRYNSVAERINPLITIQLSEMAKRLARVSRRSGTLFLNTRQAMHNSAASDRISDQR
jgi:glycosyltransferase involved in cell wall biosynthesis